MADFLTNLFTSIFTPGPTPTLVLATNVSFAALQLLLLTLLAATWFNIHFCILSVLTGALWWAINWFVRELELGKEVAEKEKGMQGKGERRKRRRAQGLGVGDESSGTERDEGVGGAETATGANADDGDQAGENMRLRVRDAKAETEELEGRRSRSSLSMSGTDSEWDKIDAEEGEKT